MLDEVQGTAAAGAVVSFLSAGTAASGAFQCADCGYGVSVQATLPRCPMCSGTSWAAVQRYAPTDAALFHDRWPASPPDQTPNSV